ncbi:Histidine triad nucleotide-binding protein 3 [Anabarilius grahami]|uniref:Histidine triad nucleotide-binding protein 3 n=1 Tax=Anabarilius grahami TaxID=495550 RepID=A0A3N0XI35_ANAGA|nr:Histidine triad nucleotide-binding protein 3 [Anabarilius grahami]
MTENKCSCEDEQDSSDDYLEETCIFCTIANGDDPYTEILAEEEKLRHKLTKNKKSDDRKRTCNKCMQPCGAM